MDDIFNHNLHYKEPATNTNAISYKTFCQLGALLNPRLRRRQRQNGTYIYSTYHLLNY